MEEYEVFKNEPEVGIPYGITEYTRYHDSPRQYFANKLPSYLGKYLRIGDPGGRRSYRSYIFENKDGKEVERYSLNKTVFVKVINDKYEKTNLVAAGGRRRKRKTKKRRRRRKTLRRKTRRRKTRKKRTKRR